MGAEGTVSTLLVCKLVAAAALFGADLQALIAQAGIERAQLDDMEGRVPFAQVYRLLDLIAAATGEAFGVRAAEVGIRQTDNVLGIAVHSSATLGEAYERMARYSALLNDTLEIRLTRDGGVVRITHDQHHQLGAHRQAVEYALAMMCLLGRSAAGERFAVEQVAFRHPAARDLTEHRRVLGRGPLAFGQPRNELVLAAELLSAPMPRASSRVCLHLDQLCEEILRLLPRRDSFVDRVRAVIAHELRGGDPSIEHVASRLGMGARSLQRRLRVLEGEGSSFQQIRDAVRIELAQQYLAKRDMALSEVSFLLGFSEPSAFHRAFRRWTGRTPDDWRRDHDDRRVSRGANRLA